MANPQWFTGLVPRTGTGSTARVSWYRAAAYAYSMGIGQPMIINTAGYVTPNTLTHTGDQIALANNIGALAGYYPTSTAAGIWVPIWDDPNQEFSIRSNVAADDTLAEIMHYIGCRAFVEPGAGSSADIDSVTGFFKGYIYAVPAPTTAGMITITGVDRGIDGEDTAYHKFTVQYTRSGHVKGSGTTGVA